MSFQQNDRHNIFIGIVLIISFIFIYVNGMMLWLKQVC